MGERSKFGGRCHSKQQCLLINGINGNPMAKRAVEKKAAKEFISIRVP